MAIQDILFLIDKYLKKHISEDEMDALENLLKHKENVQVFKNLVKDDYLLKTKNTQFNANGSFAEIESNLEQSTSKKIIRLKPFYKYATAASILLVVSLTVFLNKGGDIQFTKPVTVKTTVEPGTDKATLTLEDGTDIILEKGKIYKTTSANSNGEEIVYEAGERNNTEIVYNYITIPRGGQFSVKLSDGTQVWLNSESQLRYPVAFIEGEIRQVELVYGEAYFDVSSSAEHKGAKFKVFHQFQEIEVMGTEFNIKAYKDEANIYTTLVEGKVAISTSVNNQILAPNEQSNLDIQSNIITIATVNIYNETSWKEGVFSFREKPLIDIMNVLSRWYDMDVHFLDPDLEKAGFNGVLGKDQNIENILKIIKSFGVIKDYEIINKTVNLK